MKSTVEEDSSIASAKTCYFSDLRLFCVCASGTNNSDNETKFEHQWTNTSIRIFDLFVSPLINCYRSPSSLLVGGAEMFSQDGTTQGNPLALAMAIFGLATAPPPPPPPPTHTHLASGGLLRLAQLKRGLPTTPVVVALSTVCENGGISSVTLYLSLDISQINATKTFFVQS